MGGKSPVATNDQIVEMQKQQAAQAAANQAAINARLKTGATEIQNMFEGVPSGATLLDLSSITGAKPYSGALPTTMGAPTFNTAATTTTSPYRGLTYTQPSGGYGGGYGMGRGGGGVSGGWGAYPQTGGTTPALGQTPGRIGSTPSTASILGSLYGGGSSGYGGKLSGGYTWGVLADTGSGQPMYGIWDPQGNLVTDASSLSDLAAQKVYIGGDPSKRTGGFDAPFYDKYRQSVLDYYLPQEQQQYAKGRTALNYNLARAGQLKSSVAGMDIADLANQDVINQANIASNADTQTAALRSQVAANEQSALAQLYSTEDPSIAANTAQNLVANAQLTKPIMDPLGSLFNVAAVGVGNALSGFTNPYNYINPNAGLGGLTTQGTGQTTSGQTGGSRNVYNA